MQKKKKNHCSPLSNNVCVCVCVCVRAGRGDPLTQPQTQHTTTTTTTTTEVIFRITTTLKNMITRLFMQSIKCGCHCWQ